MRSRYVGKRLFGDAVGEMGREDLADRMPEEVYPEAYPEVYPKEHAGRTGGSAGG